MARDYVSINRDPFAREDLVRETVHTQYETCHECGNRNGYGSLFRYGVWVDTGRPVYWDSHVFCSIACRRVYYGQ